jgi:hypothetical protein
MAAVMALVAMPGLAQAASPFQQDPMGPISDVTKDWQQYQPAPAFCVKPDVKEYAQGGAGATATGGDPACRRSGFSAAETGLVKVQIDTPTLCPGCRRLFVDFSKIPAKNAPPYAYAHGHVYYHLGSLNFTYTVDPVDHSPNTKNFTNDKLVAPSGSLQEQVATAIDLHDRSYVSDTEHFVHTKSQGPYYIGPWYLNRQGRRVHGLYLDVDVVDATRYPASALNAIGYIAGFNSGQTCSSDDDAYYGGCTDWWGMSSHTVNPYPG